MTPGPGREGWGAAARDGHITNDKDPLTGQADRDDISRMCPTCGSRLPVNAETCEGCGRRSLTLSDDQYRAAKRDKACIACGRSRRGWKRLLGGSTCPWCGADYCYLCSRRYVWIGWDGLHCYHCDGEWARVYRRPWS